MILVYFRYTTPGNIFAAVLTSKLRSFIVTLMNASLYLLNNIPANT